MGDTKPGAVAADVEFTKDFQGDLLTERMVNHNLSHLTLSTTIMNFLGSHEVTLPLRPLADQIMGTNYYTELRATEYKLRVSDMILGCKATLSEDEYSDHDVLNTAEMYLRAYIDGCIKGYRGRLATENTRVYRTEEPQTPQKKGWWPF